MGTRANGTLETSILRDTRDFAALEGEWRDLYEDSALATPFQSWAWLYSWWESYGGSYDLHLVTLRHGGLLVGVLPLMLGRGFGRGRLLFVGSGQTIYLDAVVREGWEGPVAEAGIEALRRMGLWRFADLQQLRPGAAAWRVFDGWTGPRARAWQDSCYVIDVEPWDEQLSVLSQKQRSNTRRAIRRAEKDGVRCVLVPADEAEAAAGRLIAWHRESWGGRDINPEHLTPRFESFVKTAARRMTACGAGGISEFQRGEEPIASHFLVLGREFVGGYLGGATGEAFKKYSIQPLFIWDGTNVARDRGLRHFDLMWGAGPHKEQWQPRALHSHRVVLARNPVPWAPYAGYHLLRSRVRSYVNSESASPFVKEAADRYRTLRSRLSG